MYVHINGVSVSFTVPSGCRSSVTGGGRAGGEARIGCLVGEVCFVGEGGVAGTECFLGEGGVADTECFIGEGGVADTECFIGEVGVVSGAGATGEGVASVRGGTSSGSSRGKVEGLKVGTSARITESKIS